MAFLEPHGGSIRVGGRTAYSIPWETRLPVGAHPVALSPHGPSASLDPSAGEENLRGWIVVLETWKGVASGFAPSLEDLRAAAGWDLYLSGTTPEGLTAYRFKASTAGIPRDDADVASWESQAAETMAAVPENGFLKALEAVGKGILFVVLFVFIIWADASSDDDADCE